MISRARARKGWTSVFDDTTNEATPLDCRAGEWLEIKLTAILYIDGFSLPSMIRLTAIAPAASPR
jgi:hypothetical protein